ncbi:35742_t:CDS:2, partial [Gigaspora margarita]
IEKICYLLNELTYDLNRGKKDIGEDTLQEHHPERMKSITSSQVFLFNVYDESN